MHPEEANLARALHAWDTALPSQYKAAGPTHGQTDCLAQLDKNTNLPVTNP